MNYDCKNCGPEEQEFCKEYKLGPWRDGKCPLIITPEEEEEMYWSEYYENN